MGDFLDFMKSNAGIATAANVASSGIGALMNWLSTSSTNDRNERLMREQWDRELRMWKMNNAYNDPAAQMERLRRAGVNPALAYANGVENVSASSADVGNAADMKAFQMPVNPIAVDPLSSSQADLMSAQAESARADAALKRKDLDRVDQEILNLQQECDESKQRVNESVARVNLLSAQEKHELTLEFKDWLDAFYRDKEYELQKHNIMAVVKHLGVQDANIQEQTKYLIASTLANLTGLELDNMMKVLNINAKTKEIALLAQKYLAGQIDIQKAQVELAQLIPEANIKANEIYQFFKAISDMVNMGLLFGVK